MLTKLSFFCKIRTKPPKGFAKAADAKRENAKNGIGERQQTGYGTGKFEDIWGMRNAANRAVSQSVRMDRWI